MFKIRTITVAALAATAATPVAAEEAGFHLRATVPVACSIQSIDVIPGQADQLRLVSNCNAESFRIVFSGDTNIVVAAQAVGAVATVGSDSVNFRSERPGRIEALVTFSEPLPSDGGPQVALETY